jgi:hypothetical protein
MYTQFQIVVLALALFALAAATAAPTTSFENVLAQVGRFGQFTEKSKPRV